MTEQLTLKQRKFLDVYMETGNATEAAARTYKVSSRNVANNIGAENLAKPSIKKSMSELLDAVGLTDDKLAEKHKQLLNQKKKLIVRTKEGTKILEDDDATAQGKALDTAYKIKSKFPAEKLDVNENKTIKIIITEDRELLEGETVKEKVKTIV